MKVLTFLSAGLLAVGSLAAIPADAQRHGYNRGWHGQHYGGPRQGWRGDHWHRGGPRWRGGHRWDRGPRWNRGQRWRGGRNGYARVVCRTGYYGRECFRVRR